MKITLFPLALVATLASVGEARNCAAGLDHCGHFLLEIGQYYSWISDELTRATKATCFKKVQINDALFACGANGAIKFKKYCKNGCEVGARGQHDYCWT